MKGGDSAVLGLPKFNPDPWSQNLHTRSFDIMQIHLQVHGYQFIEMIKHLPLVSGPGWSLKRRLVGVHENSMLPEVLQMVYLC
jgi:peroxisomal enoyl-CoA hydratase 2